MSTAPHLFKECFQSQAPPTHGALVWLPWEHWCFFVYFRSLAAEWGRYGHRFNIIQPGPIKTKVHPMWPQLMLFVCLFAVCFCLSVVCWWLWFRGHSAVWTQQEPLRGRWSTGSRRVDSENQMRSQTLLRTSAATLRRGCLELWVHTDQFTLPWARKSDWMCNQVCFQVIRFDGGEYVSMAGEFNELRRVSAVLKCFPQKHEWEHNSLFCDRVHSCHIYFSEEWSDTDMFSVTSWGLKLLSSYLFMISLLTKVISAPATYIFLCSASFYHASYLLHVLTKSMSVSQVTSDQWKMMEAMIRNTKGS